jgi:hypothetical protein
MSGALRAKDSFPSLRSRPPKFNQKLQSNLKGWPAISAVMNDEKLLWSIATHVLAEHGHGASAFALDRARDCAGGEDGRRFALWLAVADRCSKLLCPLPSPGESMH